MHETYHNPEILVQTFDGVVRDGYVVATHCTDDCLPSEHSIDYSALMQSMALKGSARTREKIGFDARESGGIR